MRRLDKFVEGHAQGQRLAIAFGDAEATEEARSAGHDAPFVLGSNAPPRQLDTEGGPPLGVIEGFTFPVDRDRLEPDEVLLLYTDGVTEAMDGAGALYGTTRLTATLGVSAPENAASRS